MSFKPKSAGNAKASTGPRENYKFPIPEDGTQPARVSLIVDLGVQAREDFEDPKTKELKPQKPCQQVYVAVDLVDQVVDYGGDIGEQQYRLPLNKSFMGELEGINFTAVPPRDADGNMVEGKLWTFHVQNMLYKIAKATGHSEVNGGATEAENMDIERLLGEALMVNVEVKQSEGKKKGEDGKPIIYTNVKAAGLSPLPKKLTADDLRNPPLLVTFDNATVDTVRFLRRDVRQKIKQATNYVGSAMQEAIEAFEATLTDGNANVPAKVATPVKTAPKKQEPVVEEEFDDDQSPF